MSSKKERAHEEAPAATKPAKKISGRDPIFREFHERLLRDFNAEELVEIGAENIEAITTSLMEWSKTRMSGEALIRAYNPSIEKNAWTTAHSVLEVICDDLPFLIDTILSEITAENLSLHAVTHPTLPFTRDAGGARQPAKGDEKQETVIHIQFDQQSDDIFFAQLEDRVRQLLRDIDTVVDDFPLMLEHLDQCIEHLEHNYAHLPEDEIYEANAFLHWLRDNHFAFLGSRDYELTGDIETGDLVPLDGSSLGLLRDSKMRILRRGEQNKSLTPERREFLALPTPLLITKSNTRSSIHRRVHMDYIGIKKFSTSGELCGETRFVGLFTAEAYNDSVFNIPLLSRRVRKALEATKLTTDDFNRRGLQNILEKFPRDELFQITEEEMFQTGMRIRDLYERPKTRLLLRMDRFDRYASALVYVPRERYNSDVRNRIADVLVEAFDGRLSAYYPYFDDSPLARVHMIIGFDQKPDPERIDELLLEQRVVEVTQNWFDKLESKLKSTQSPHRARALFKRYRDAIPVTYCENTPAADAVVDIETIENLRTFPDVAVRCFPAEAHEPCTTKFKLYRAETSVPLSDIVPILENLGFKIQHEQGFKFTRPESAVWVHEFHMDRISQDDVLPADTHDKIEQTFLAVWQESTENDRFNSLVTNQSLTWRYAGLLRSLSRYLRLIGKGLSKPYTVSVMNKYPTVTKHLVDLFNTKFDPQRSADRDQRLQDLHAAIEQDLEQVESLDEDRTFRQLLNLIQSIWRTNFFQTTADGTPKPYTSFKINSGNVEGIPLPKPFAEIFVYSPEVEGIHIRFGKVARGGLRWSDRREDYRTEVLGLVKAQKVKNAVIVPVGAKGGFVPRKLNGTSDRDERQRIGTAAYKLFISSLLDITDNIVEGDVIQPEKVVPHDDRDPYLVVAADKGTATFSDTANEISSDYGFWLDDAFASGGSNGYDHKKMGITAKGAWEAVKRHFREQSKNIQEEEFTVAGVGDMSGDVFGNGMLLSKHIRLVAAFDHRHIFIDPNPDSAASFAERERLFALPRSSWDDYDKSLISKGGGVFSRDLKSIQLTGEIRQALNIEADRLPPFELISEILKAPVELLWFGGIGTYIKAEDEHNSMVGDRANDAVRVNAKDVRAQVIGEGANLGITQEGRIEFAQAQGRINTDAIDNSAGVDCSDHEVNIKILLSSLVAKGEITLEARNTLLEKMTDEVSDLVLENNYDQTLALSLAELRGTSDLDSYKRLMAKLEAEGVLDRTVETLPSDDEINERLLKDESLTRPELAVLLAYAKLQTFEEIVDSPLLESADLDEEIVDYFPTHLRDTYTAEIVGHQLRNEIIATILSNRVVNLGGISFVHRVADITGAKTDEIVKAFVITDRVFGIRAIRDQINGLDSKIPTDIQLGLHDELYDFLRRQLNWFLRTKTSNSNRSISQITDEFKTHADELTEMMMTVLPEQRLAGLTAAASQLEDRGIPADLARNMAMLKPLLAACDICRLMTSSRLPLKEVACTYFAIGETLKIDVCREQSTSIRGAEHWDRLTLRRATAGFYSLQHRLTASAINHNSAQELPTETRLSAWLDTHKSDIKRALNVIDTLSHTGDWTVSKITVAESELRTLADAVDTNDARNREKV